MHASHGTLLALGPGHVDLHRWFPERVTPAALPTVEATRYDRFGFTESSLQARVALCVNPDGSTSGVRLITSSGVSAFDLAAVHDITEWRYQPYSGSAAARVCAPIIVRYVP